MGIGGYFSVSTEPALATGLGACAVLILMLLMFWRYFLMRVLILAVTLVAAGFVSGTLRSWQLETPVLAKKLSPRMITGVVSDVRHYSDGKLHIVIVNPEIRGIDPLHKVRIKVNKFTDLPHPGDRLKVRAGLLPPPPPTMPGDFDYARQIWFQGIGAVGYAIGIPVILEKGPEAFTLSNKKRLLMAEEIRATISGDAGGLAAALITGMRWQKPGPDL